MSLRDIQEIDKSLLKLSRQEQKLSRQLRETRGQQFELLNQRKLLQLRDRVGVPDGVTICVFTWPDDKQRQISGKTGTLESMRRTRCDVTIDGTLWNLPIDDLATPIEEVSR